MRKVCRNFSPFYICGQSLDRIAALLQCLPPHLGLCQLLDVMHHAIQAPLRIDLGSPTVIQTRQALVVPDVAKHRLHRADALAIKLPASR